jgi:hypothetical protein
VWVGAPGLSIPSLPYRLTEPDTTQSVLAKLRPVKARCHGAPVALVPRISAACLTCTRPVAATWARGELNPHVLTDTRT